MTWDNATSSAEMHHCLFVQKGDNTCTMQNVYRIPINATGENLNHLTCGDYNRQRTYCSQCIEGYGPALFSGDATCADCSIQTQTRLDVKPYISANYGDYVMHIYNAVSNQRNFQST